VFDSEEDMLAVVAEDPQQLKVQSSPSGLTSVVTETHPGGERLRL